MARLHVMVHLGHMFAFYIYPPVRMTNSGATSLLHRSVFLYFFIFLAGMGMVESNAKANCTSPVSACANSDTFWPHAGPAKFRSLSSTDTSLRGSFGVALITTYLRHPVKLKIPSPSPSSRTDISAISDQINTNFLWSYGITNHLAVDFAIPVTIVQDGLGLSSISSGESLRKTTIRDMRLGLVYHLWDNLKESKHPVGSLAPENSESKAHYFAVAARFEISAPTADSNVFSGDRSVVFSPELIASYHHGALFAGASIGLRLRGETKIFLNDMGSQAAFTAGIGYALLPSDLLAAVLELSLFPSISGSHIVPGEWSLGFRTGALFNHQLIIDAHFGTGLTRDFSSPELRTTLGIRFVPQLDEKKRFDKQNLNEQKGS